MSSLKEPFNEFREAIRFRMRLLRDAEHRDRVLDAIHWSNKESWLREHRTANA